MGLSAIPLCQRISLEWYGDPEYDLKSIPSLSGTGLSGNSW